VWRTSGTIGLTLCRKTSKIGLTLCLILAKIGLTLCRKSCGNSLYQCEFPVEELVQAILFSRNVPFSGNKKILLFIDEILIYILFHRVVGVFPVPASNVILYRFAYHILILNIPVKRIVRVINRRRQFFVRPEINA
jgi:hypothetical protein